MTRARYDRLLPVAQARYEAEFAAIRGLLSAEAQCRAQLARIDDLAQSAREQAAQPGAMQLLGADVVFQKSLATNRARLNSELARILAHKASAIEKVRLAFGQRQAIQTTLTRMAEEADKAKAKVQAERALAPWLSGKPPG